MRVLFFGSCPMPVEKELPAQGPGIRTWQLVKPVCDAGHTVFALCLRTEGLYTESIGDCVSSKPYPNLTMWNMKYEVFTNVERIRRMVEEFRPEAIVGAASILPNFTASHVRDMAPFWADCFGDPIAEIQAKAEMYGRERTAEELFGVWKYYRAVLACADHFSALSSAQTHALIGQLALLGRLGYETAGTPLVHTIPCGVEGMPPVPEKTAEPFLRGKRFPADAFVVCFSGSYNTWMDVDLLYEGLEEAMGRVPNLYFLSIGGGTKGYNEKLYNDFCKKVEASANRDRYVLCGWVPFEEASKYYAEADVGINVDRFAYEGVLGSRSRIVQFLAHGLPVITTPLSEVSINLARANLVFCFAMKGEAESPVPVESLPELLMHLVADRDMLEQAGRLGQKIVTTRYSFARTTAPLISWLASPRRAPDNASRSARGGERAYLNEIERAMDYEHTRRMIEFLMQEKHRLDRIRRNPFYRLFRFFKRLFGGGREK